MVMQWHLPILGIIYHLLQTTDCGFSGGLAHESVVDRATKSYVSIYDLQDRIWMCRQCRGSSFQTYDLTVWSIQF